MTVDKRAAMKAGLQKRTQESYEKRDDSGQFGSYFKDEVVGKLWKCTEGDHILDIIPYLAGSFDPNTKHSDPTYVLILWVHFGVGINQDAYVCPARNYNQPCPICEYREGLRNQEDPDEELIKELTPKRRSIYNVLIYDNEKEERKGVQIFDAAHWFMEKHLVSLAKVPERGMGKSTASYIAFSDPDEGKSISFNRKGTKRNSEFLGHKFVDRDYTIPDEILTSAYILDECVTQSSYEEIKDAFYGIVSGEVAPEAPNPAPPPVAATPAPTPDIGSGLRTRRPLATPPTATLAQAPQPVATGEKVCLGGGTFGVDCEKLQACATCPIWDDCSAETDKKSAAAAGDRGPPSQHQASRPAATAPRPTPPAPAPRPVPSAPSAGAPIPVGPRRIGPRR